MRRHVPRCRLVQPLANRTKFGKPFKPRTRFVTRFPHNLPPPETLTQIADFSCRTFDQAMTMAQVSRCCRSVFTSYPWIRTDVTVKAITPVCHATTALKNSRGLPLRLNLQIHLDQRNTSRPPHCLASIHGTSRSANFRPYFDPFAILYFLELHHGRIQKLRIRFLYHDNTCDIAVTLIEQPLFRCSFDVLDSLSLSIADVCQSRYRSYATPASSAKIKGNFPRLGSLKLSGIRGILQPELRCPMLKSLSISPGIT